MLENLSQIDWSTITQAISGIIAGAGTIGTIIGCLKAKDWKGAFAALQDLMNPYVPQTEEQTKLIESGKVNADTWKMDETEVKRIHEGLKAIAANISIDALKAVISQAEKDNQVEYAIRCCRNEKPETYPTVCVSYGVGEIFETYIDAQAWIQNHSAFVYSVAG